ncbi:MAG: DNA polymerase III subunit gamma/tau [Candidatus Liptonbacteria bacterium]|nr:DNA polymerase III subunit gamma/tau [Candidatus Liptonbacteria bacterium]
MSLALYRKYRPKKLEDLIGQETTVQILKNAAKSDRLGHAYLFYGPRGTGKTSTARLIAKLLNCEKRLSDEKFRLLGEPCGECSHCKEIDMNFSFDVVEIDAASNRGIDEIRNLKENIQTSPVKGDYKVYIIDEVHMLTGPAWNALLKTLEEPPAHAVFVLATTEYEKIPATVSSRAQRFVFKKASKVKIIEKIKMIAGLEKIAIEDAALELIAAIGDGSFRDAESLLDQLSSSGEKITLEVVEQLTGRTGLKKVSELSELILKKDAAGALSFLAEMSEEGVNLTQLAKDLIHYLRKILSLKTNPGLERFFSSELTKEEIEHLKKLSALADTERQIKFLKSLILAYTEIRYSPFPIVPLEVAIIENLQTP